MHRTFQHTSMIPARPDDVMAFHAQPDAIQQLTLPLTWIRIADDHRSSLTSGTITFTLWLGPIPIPWVAQHEPGPIPTAFTDRMQQGPMQFWVHQHIFEPVEGGTVLTDRITFAHYPGWRGWATRLLFDGLPLQILFLYRHWRTRRALARQKSA